QHQFAAAFAAVQNKQSQEPQKQRIADLLFRLATVSRLEESVEGKGPPGVLESKAYERFQAVVGVSAAAAAVDHYAAALAQFAADQRDTIDRDRERFARDYRERLTQIAVLSGRLREVEELLAREKAIAADKATLVAERIKQRDDLKKELAQAQQEAQDALKQQ